MMRSRVGGAVSAGPEGTGIWRRAEEEEEEEEGEEGRKKNNKRTRKSLEQSQALGKGDLDLAACSPLRR